MRSVIILAVGMALTPAPLRETGAKPPQLLIDIQTKLREGYGEGFEHWARIENLKRSAKTLLYIQDSGIDSYAELKSKCSDACAAAMVIQKQIREIEDRQKAINELQAHIGTYKKTRETYARYKASNFSAKFYEANRADISRCKTAKNYFNEHGSIRNGKLPRITELQEQWAELEKQKRPLYAEYKKANQKFKDLCAAKSNASKMLGVDQNRECSRQAGMEI